MCDVFNYVWWKFESSGSCKVLQFLPQNPLVVSFPSSSSSSYFSRVPRTTLAICLYVLSSSDRPRSLINSVITSLQTRWVYAFCQRIGPHFDSWCGYCYCFDGVGMSLWNCGR
jgi:hypothetical protein